MAKTTKTKEQKLAEAESKKAAVLAAKKKKEADKKAADLKKKRASGDNKDIYAVTLSVNDQVFTSDNEDLAQAILSLNPTVQIKTKAIIKVEYNGLVAERMLFARDLRRPLINRDAATFLAKNLSLRLK